MAIRAIPTDREMPARPAPPGPVPEPVRSGVPLPPDPLSYRLKRRLLGQAAAQRGAGAPAAGQAHGPGGVRVRQPVVVGYATEEILHVLIPVAGVVAFSLVFPITVAMCVVLGFLILSYRETIKEYPSAGGAYLVTKDNFGSTVAQVAGASLLIDYILTVAVSASAGTAALDLGLRRARAVTGCRSPCSSSP